jgi:hypothetical protein
VHKRSWRAVLLCAGLMGVGGRTEDGPAWGHRLGWKEGLLLGQDWGWGAQRGPCGPRGLAGSHGWVTDFGSAAVEGVGFALMRALPSMGRGAAAAAAPRGCARVAWLATVLWCLGTNQNGAWSSLAAHRGPSSPQRGQRQSSRPITGPGKHVHGTFAKGGGQCARGAASACANRGKGAQGMTDVRAGNGGSCRAIS